MNEPEGAYIPPVYTFYISVEQAFRTIITAINSAIVENAFSPDVEQYKDMVAKLEKMLNEHMETGKINI